MITPSAELTRIAARDNILLKFPMLQLLKIAFTFGKELLFFARVFQMSNLPSGAEIINRPDFAWLFLNTFGALK